MIDGQGLHGNLLRQKLFRQGCRNFFGLSFFGSFSESLSSGHEGLKKIRKIRPRAKKIPLFPSKKKQALTKKNHPSDFSLFVP
jgi:hypothetical protein